MALAESVIAADREDRSVRFSGGGVVVQGRNKPYGKWRGWEPRDVLRRYRQPHDAWVIGDMSRYVVYTTSAKTNGGDREVQRRLRDFGRGGAASGSVSSGGRGRNTATDPRSSCRSPRTAKDSQQCHLDSSPSHAALGMLAIGHHRRRPQQRMRPRHHPATYIVNTTMSGSQTGITAYVAVTLERPILYGGDAICPVSTFAALAFW